MKAKPMPANISRQPTVASSLHYVDKRMKEMGAKLATVSTAFKESPATTVKTTQQHFGQAIAKGLSNLETLAVSRQTTEKTDTKTVPNKSASESTSPQIKQEEPSLAQIVNGNKTNVMEQIVSLPLPTPLKDAGKMAETLQVKYDAYQEKAGNGGVQGFSYHNQTRGEKIESVLSFHATELSSKFSLENLDTTVQSGAKAFIESGGFDAIGKGVTDMVTAGLADIEGGWEDLEPDAKVLRGMSAIQGKAEEAVSDLKPTIKNFALDLLETTFPKLTSALKFCGVMDKILGALEKKAAAAVEKELASAYLNTGTTTQKQEVSEKIAMLRDACPQFGGISENVLSVALSCLENPKKAGEELLKNLASGTLKPSQLKDILKVADSLQQAVRDNTEILGDAGIKQATTDIVGFASHLVEEKMTTTIRDSLGFVGNLLIGKEVKDMASGFANSATKGLRQEMEGVLKPPGHTMSAIGQAVTEMKAAVTLAANNSGISLPSDTAVSSDKSSKELPKETKSRGMPTFKSAMHFVDKRLHGEQSTGSALPKFLRQEDAFSQENPMARKSVSSEGSTAVQTSKTPSQEVGDTDSSTALNTEMATEKSDKVDTPQPETLAKTETLSTESQVSQGIPDMPPQLTSFNATFAENLQTSIQLTANAEVSSTAPVVLQDSPTEKLNFQAAVSILEAAEKGPVMSELISHVTTEVTTAVTADIKAKFDVVAEAFLNKVDEHIGEAGKTYISEALDTLKAAGEAKLDEMKETLQNTISDFQESVTTQIKEAVNNELESVLGGKGGGKGSFLGSIRDKIKESGEKFLAGAKGMTFEKAATKFLDTVEAAVNMDVTNLLSDLKEKVKDYVKTTVVGQASTKVKDDAKTFMTQTVNSFFKDTTVGQSMVKTYEDASAYGTAKKDALKTELKKVLPEKYWPPDKDVSLTKEEGDFITNLATHSLQTLRDTEKEKIESRIEAKIEDQMSGATHTDTSGVSESSHTEGASHTDGASNTDGTSSPDKSTIKDQIDYKKTTEQKAAEVFHTFADVTGLLQGVFEIKTGIQELLEMRREGIAAASGATASTASGSVSGTAAVVDVSLDGTEQLDKPKDVEKPPRKPIVNILMGTGRIIGGAAILAGATAIASVALPIVGALSGAVSFVDSCKDGLARMEYGAVEKLLNNEKPNSLLLYMTTGGKSMDEVSKMATDIKEKYGDDAQEFVKLKKEFHVEKGKAHLMRATTKFVATFAFTGLSAIGGIFLPLAVGAGIAFAGFKVAGVFDNAASYVDNKIQLLDQKHPAPPQVDINEVR